MIHTIRFTFDIGYESNKKHLQTIGRVVQLVMQAGQLRIVGILGQGVFEQLWEEAECSNGKHCKNFFTKRNTATCSKEIDVFATKIICVSLLEILFFYLRICLRLK